MLDAHPMVLPLVLCLPIEVVLCAGFFFRERCIYRRSFIYFDTQDFYRETAKEGLASTLPVASEKGTFQPFLKQYISVSKILITVSAASITFATTHSDNIGIYQAKLILAASIVYGVAFCALVLYFYDEYGYDVESYTPFRYALVESLGFSFLISFLLGFGWWAFNLLPVVKPETAGVSVC